MTLVRTQEEAISKIKKMMKTLPEPLDNIENLPSGIYVHSQGRRYRAAKPERFGGKAAGYRVYDFPWAEIPQPQRVKKAKGDYPKLIGRNQKKKAFAIFDRAHHIRVYTLDNYFNGRDAEKIGHDGTNWMTKTWLQMPRSQLTEDSPGQYRLHIHANRWAEFQA